MPGVIFRRVESRQAWKDENIQIRNEMMQSAIPEVLVREQFRLVGQQHNRIRSASTSSPSGAIVRDVSLNSSSRRSHDLAFSVFLFITTILADQAIALSVTPPHYPLKTRKRLSMIGTTIHVAYESWSTKC